MTKADMNVGAEQFATHSSAEFSHLTKQAESSLEVQKDYIFQLHDGDQCDCDATLISNTDEECFVEKKTTDDPAYMELLHDLDSMTKVQLRKKYSGEANSHRNMLSRIKTKGAKVHDSFHSFSDFLRYVGPKPTKNATIDRKNNHDPEYAPGKVRWSDKQTQNRNKGDSLIFTCPNTGRSYTASQLARKQNVTATAIRSRRARAWTDAEIILGERSQAQTEKKTSCVAPFGNSFRTGGRPLAARVAFERAKAYIEHERKQSGIELEQFYTFCRNLISKLPPPGDGSTFTLDDEVALKYFRIQQMTQGSIDLSDGEADPLKGPTDVGSAGRKDEEVGLTDLVEKLNERFGTAFTRADQLFFEQIRESAESDDRIVEAALANKYDNFASYLDRMLDELFIDRMDGNEEVFSKVMSDQPFRSAVHKGLARELYERIRSGRQH